METLRDRGARVGKQFKTEDTQLFGDIMDKNKIWNCKSTGSKGKITLWNYFHVNRQTGKTRNNVFAIKFFSGPRKDRTFVCPCSHLEYLYEPSKS